MDIEIGSCGSIIESINEGLYINKVISHMILDPTILNSIYTCVHVNVLCFHTAGKDKHDLCAHVEVYDTGS